jgi:hypothetical protein
MLYLHTGSTYQHAIVEAENAWHWLSLIPDWFSTALESPFHTTYLAKHYATTLRVSLSDIRSYLLASVPS